MNYENRLELAKAAHNACPHKYAIYHAVNRELKIAGFPLRPVASERYLDDPDARSVGIRTPTIRRELFEEAVAETIVRVSETPEMSSEQARRIARSEVRRLLRERHRQTDVALVHDSEGIRGTVEPHTGVIPTTCLGRPVDPESVEDDYIEDLDRRRLLIRIYRKIGAEDWQFFWRYFHRPTNIAKDRSRYYRLRAKIISLGGENFLGS